MKLSLNWLKEYVALPQDLPIEQLASDLTLRTVEVEAWSEVGAQLTQVVVGKILQVEPHPQADRLRVLQLDVGRESAVQIVCGGLNLFVEQLVAVALPGAMVHWHGEGEAVAIKRSKLRGVSSEGMVCAADELELEQIFPVEAEGQILDLSSFTNAYPGQALADLLGLDDIILEIDNKSMTHRPDLWGHYGLARELAAIYKVELRALPALALPPNLPPFALSIQDPAACPCYSASVFTNVSNQEAPLSLKLRLQSVGVRPRSLLVDLSNYVMLAVGEPVHVFAAERIGQQIEVRLAEPEEKLLLLDGNELELNTTDLLICSEGKAIALAGVMGGKDSAVSADSTSIVFEAATFAKGLIRHTATKHALRTESCARFEKGIDTARADSAVALFQQLLSLHCPEAKLTAYGKSCSQPTQAQKIAVKLDYIAKRLGRRLALNEIDSVLSALGFSVSASEGEQELVLIEAPLWRSTGDISEAADIVEEIARLSGYENFAFTPPQIALEQAVQAPQLDLERRLREYLALRCGCQEVFTYPWVEQSLLDICRLDASSCVQLATPPAPEQKCLRSSLLPALLHTALLNERYYEHFAYFELAQVFQPQLSNSSQLEALPLQERHLGVGLYGSFPWLLFRQLKGILEALPRLCACEPICLQEATRAPWADAQVHLGIFTPTGEEIGQLALLSAQAKKELGLKRGYLAVCELNVEKLQPLASRSNSYTPLHQFPLVQQDLSLLLPENCTWADIEQLLKERVERLVFAEEYRGEQVPVGKKSLLLSLWLGKKDGTLTASEIDERMQGIRKRLLKSLGVELRS